MMHSKASQLDGGEWSIRATTSVCKKCCDVITWKKNKTKHVQFLKSFYEAKDQMKYQEDIEKVE